VIDSDECRGRHRFTAFAVALSAGSSPSTGDVVAEAQARRRPPEKATRRLAPRDAAGMMGAAPAGACVVATGPYPARGAPQCLVRFATVHTGDPHSR
jgi:hypothetical protein